MSSTYAGTDVFPATITIPDDGDAATASSVNAAFEGLADRTTYLKANEGPALKELFFDGSAGTFNALTSTTSSTFVDVTDASIGSSGIMTLATTTVVGDIILVDARWHGAKSAACVIRFRMMFSENGGAFAELDSSADLEDSDAVTAVTPVFTCASRRVVVTAGSFRLKFQLSVDAGAATVYFHEPWSVRVSIFRPAA